MAAISTALRQAKCGQSAMWEPASVFYSVKTEPRPPAMGCWLSIMPFSLASSVTHSRKIVIASYSVKTEPRRQAMGH